MISKVRSTTSVQPERNLTWYDDQVHPYTYLDGYVIRVAPSGYAFTQPVDPEHVPHGRVLSWSNLVDALLMLGWEAAQD